MEVVPEHSEACASRGKEDDIPFLRVLLAGFYGLEHRFREDERNAGILSEFGERFFGGTDCGDEFHLGGKEFFQAVEFVSFVGTAGNEADGGFRKRPERHFKALRRSGLRIVDI